MKLGIISDTHIVGDPGHLLPEWVMDAFRTTEMIFHAGDIENEQVLNALSSVAPVYAVRGNCDHNLHLLPKTREIKLEGGTVAIAHKQEDAWSAVNENTILMIFGHTHVPLIAREGRLTLINPGSPRIPRGGNPPSVVVAEITDGKICAEFKYPTSAVD